MAFGGMLGGIVGSVGGALAKKMGSKKPTDDGTTISKNSAMAGSKAALKGPMRKRKLGVGRSMSMR